VNKQQHLDRYLDRLTAQPDAAPPPDLDPTLADFARLLHDSQAVPAPPAATRQRLWARIRAKADTPGAAARRHTNGQHVSPVSLPDKEHHPMHELTLTPTARPTARVWQYSLTLAVAALVVVTLGGLLTALQGSPMPGLNPAMTTLQQTPTPVPPDDSGPTPLILPAAITAELAADAPEVSYRITVESDSLVLVHVMTDGPAVGFSQRSTFTAPPEIVVNPGDTLLDLSKRYLIPVDTLTGMLGLDDPADLEPGTYALPGGGGGGGGGGLSQEYITLTPMRAGDEHIITLSNPQEAALPYTLHAEAFDPDVLFNANFLAYGDTLTAALGPDQPRALYAFNASRGDSIAVGVDAEGLDARLALVGPYGTLITSDEDSGPGSNPELFDVPLPDNGIHYLLVLPQGAPTAGTVTFTLIQLDSDTLPPVEAIESFSSLEDVPPIAIGEVVSGTLDAEARFAPHRLIMESDAPLLAFVQAADFVPVLGFELDLPADYVADPNRAGSGGGGGGGGRWGRLPRHGRIAAAWGSNEHHSGDRGQHPDAGRTGAASGHGRGLHPDRPGAGRGHAAE
jgi:hypothetical protein